MLFAFSIHRLAARHGAAIGLLGGLLVTIATSAIAADASPEAPLVIGNRTIHVFRAYLGANSPAERAETAKQRILRAFEAPGEGWTSVRSSAGEAVVELDGTALFTVLPGDARGGESVDALANHASRILQKTWAESRERRDWTRMAHGLGQAALAALALAVALILIVKGARLARQLVTRLIANRAWAQTSAGARIGTLISQTCSQLLLVFAWLLGLLAGIVFLGYSMGQFALTRPAGEQLYTAVYGLAVQGITAIAAAIPGVFVSIVIFLAAWIATQFSTQLLDHVATRPGADGLLDAHTAPATRRIANASIWLFAVAMAYPYLPGSHTEAFKGLSVILGIMVSIGASGLVGQIASGLMLVYTRALLVGEYVRIQEQEGTVTEIGLFVTRIRTGLGEEISLPNALVLANVTRNYSRVPQGRGCIIDVAVTIGYDTPWRQVHAMLLNAAKRVPEIQAEPAPYVVQSALTDFNVAYKLVVCANSSAPAFRVQVAGALFAAIQDEFNRHGVQIMSPHYLGDPARPKTVPEAEWFAAPAQRLP